MELFATYTYLLAAVCFSGLWLLLGYLLPVRNRIEMLGVSFGTMILGYFVQAMHLTDWWQPAYLYSGLTTIEDTLFGFAVGGVIYATYTLVAAHWISVVSHDFSLRVKIVVIIFSNILLFGLFYGFGLHSFWASMIALSLPIAVVLLKDRHYLMVMNATAFLVTITALLGYLLGIYFNPSFVADTYLLDQLSGVLVFGVPVEELIWFYVASLGIVASVIILRLARLV